MKEGEREMEDYAALKEDMRHLTATLPLSLVKALEDELAENDPDMLDWEIKIKVKRKKED